MRGNSNFLVNSELHKISIYYNGSVFDNTGGTKYIPPPPPTDTPMEFMDGTEMEFMDGTDMQFMR